MYTLDEVKTFVEEEDVKFIRLAFCDTKGKLKNVSILSSELEKAFKQGISFDASAITGFDSEEKSDLLLFPNTSTLSFLPWRPSSGRVVRMFCDIKRPDLSDFEIDGRFILKNAVQYAKSKGISCYFGAECEFYLFKNDENGEKTNIPFDDAGYMDVAPDDKGEDVRREICLTLSEMGFTPETSHHEEGPGQNEIDFKYSSALKAADNTTTFKSVVKTIATRYGLSASFEPKPLKDKSGNGMHINMSIKSDDGKDYSEQFMAGIMAHIKEITAFLNPQPSSYDRLGEKKAPKYITWSPQNRSQLIRIPAASGEYERIELRSADCTANPYIAYALLIFSGIDGIEKGMKACEPMNINLFTASKEVCDTLEKLPESLSQAKEIARSSEFVKSILPPSYFE